MDGRGNNEVNVNGRDEGCKRLRIELPPNDKHFCFFQYQLIIYLSFLNKFSMIQ
jgi:hypothetical protein